MKIFVKCFLEKNKYIWITFFILFSSRIVYSSQSSSELFKEGVEFAKKEKYVLAIQFFKDSANKSPYFSLAHYGLGKTYLLVPGKIDNAILHLNQSVKLDRSYSRAFYYLGTAYFFKKKYILAIKNLIKSYKMSENQNVIALYNVGCIYDILGNKRLSSLYFTKYIDKISEEDDF